MLTISTIQTKIRLAEESFPHEECGTCECFLGYVTQLGLDSTPDAQAVLEVYYPERSQVHGCLGCDPCPPGDLYSTYLQELKK